MEYQSVITLTAAILAFVASLIAAAVSLYHASLGRFVRERWWERNLEAYSRVVEPLADMVYYHEQHHNDAFSYSKMSSDQKAGARRALAA